MRTAAISWTIKQYAKMVMNGSVKFDNPVQRSFVWEPERKSDLIDSAMRNFPIPPLYTKRNLDSVDETTSKKPWYDVLDGQQRSITFSSFLNDEWALVGLNPIQYNENTYNVNGLKFSELPEELRDEICGRTLTVYYLEDATQEEINELFRKLNNGKPLNTKQKNVAYCRDLTTVMEIARHPVFEKILTDKSFANKNYVGIIMKIWSMLNMDIDTISFDSKTFNNLLLSITMTEEQINNIESVLDYLNSVYECMEKWDTKPGKELYKKMRKEVHYISFVPAINKAIGNGLSALDFCDFVQKFFKSVTREYTNATTSSTEKNTAIIARDIAVNDAFDNYLESFTNLSMTTVAKNVVSFPSSNEQLDTEKDK